MKIAITGASGFIGSRLVTKLLSEHCAINVLGRKRAGLPAEVKFWQWSAGEEQPPAGSLEDCDAVINLAGEPIAQRWNAEVKRRIYDSRVKGTRDLVATMARLQQKPRVLINASAVGYYGSRGDEVLDEASAPGKGFLAQVCTDWESAADAASAFGVRVVKVRFAVVLGRNGGALHEILPMFKRGMGGKIGSGSQWFSWIHLEDLTGLIVYALENENIAGPLNGSAPSPVTNEAFTQALGHALQRPAVVTVPALLLKMKMGEMAQEVLDSHRVVPAAAQQAGFAFQFPTIETALENAVKET